MAQKKVVKKVINSIAAPKKAVVKKTINQNSNEKVLIENFVSLQKVMTNMSIKFDTLTNQISKLLELFEASANALAKKDINYSNPMDEQKINDKLNSILDQNKTIARGLALMHENPRSNPPQQMNPPTAVPTMVPSTPPQMQTPNIQLPKESYQKSRF